MELIQENANCKYALKNEKGEFYVGNRDLKNEEWKLNPSELHLQQKSYYTWLAPRVGIILSNCEIVKLK